MNNFIKAKLKNNRFRCNLTGSFENMENIDTTAIIDTGCTHSRLSGNLIYVFTSDEDKIDAKRLWINKGRKHTITFGVDNENICKELKPENPNLSIFNKIYNIEIDGVNIGNKYMSVGYNSVDITLIGMEFMKDWDIHISKSIKTNEIVFLACPFNQINEEYIKALKDEFDIGKTLQNNLYKQIDRTIAEANYINRKIN